MVAFKNAADIQEEIDELTDRIEAIVDLAKTEDRGLTDEEKSQVDGIQGDDGSGGQIADLEKDLAREKAIEDRIASKALARVATGEIVVPGGEDSGNPMDAVVVPARAKIHQSLKAFADNAEGEKQAYVAGRYCAALLGNTASRNWLGDNGFTNAMSQGDNDSAGILVPSEMSTAIIRLVEQYGVVRNQMSVQPMTLPRWSGPVRVSGMTAYPVAETNTANEGSNTGTKSQPTYRLIELVARKWKAWTKMSDELNENAFVSIGEQVTLESAQAFAYAEDNAGFNGDSTSAFHGITGILNALAAGSIFTAASGKLNFGDLVLADFETMVGQLPDFAGISPAWNISKEGYYASMHPLQMAAGGNTVADIAAGGQRTFLSFPVVFTNVLNKTLTDQASTKLLTLGDFGMGAKFGAMSDVRMSVSTERFWDTDQIGIKAIEEFDINVHSKGTASEAGAILALQTAAS